MALTNEGFGSLFNRAFEPAESGETALPDGFTVDVLPSLSDRNTILAAGNSLLNVPLETPRWYSITIEILVKNATQAHYYLYRTQVEAYRDGGVAVLHLSPTPPIVEAPSGGFGLYTVTLGVSGSNVTVQLNNGSPNSITFARYVGYTRKPIP